MFINSAKKIIKQKYIIILFIMEITDLALTSVGLKLGYIHEGNPLADHIYQHSFALLISIKLLITFLATFTIGFGYTKYDWVKKVIWVSLIVYILVMGLHGFAIGFALKIGLI